MQHALAATFIAWVNSSRDCRCGLVHRVMCLFTSWLLLLLIVHTHRGMARLSLSGWLVTCQDGHPSKW